MELDLQHLQLCALRGLSGCRLRTVVLLLLLSMAASFAIGKNLSDPNTAVNICTCETSPVVFCIDRDPQDYDGYEIALFERVRQQLGWESSRLNWTCMDDWDGMLEHLQNDDGECDIAVAGVDISRANLMDRGIVFSYPTLSAGYRIMVSTKSTSSTVDYWIFLDAFAWELWLAILLTCLAVALILWGVERWASVEPTPAGMPPPPELQELAFQSLGRPMQINNMTSRNFAGSFIILLFSFMMLVLTALYTGSTAANLTASQLQSNIRSVEDLPGKKVGTWQDPEYMSDMAKRGIKAIGMPWGENVGTQEDEQAMYDALRRDDIQALVLDSYVLEYAAASQCDLQVVGGTWDEYDSAVAFPSGFEDQQLLKTYNQILVSLKDSGDMESLQRQYLSPPEAKCKTLGVTDSSLTQITFQEVSGLWILLGAAVGVALVMVLASMLALRSARKIVRSRRFRDSLTRLRTLGGSWRRKHDAGGVELGACPPSNGQADPAASACVVGTASAPPLAEVLAAVRRLEQLLAPHGSVPD